MREHITLKIGEFARISQVSIATLRYYEKVGLFQPHTLDPDTGYRFYSLDQLPRLNRILALKELGFPLEEIAQLLEGSLSPEHLRGMFMLKLAQAQEMIDAEHARLQRISARLRQIEQEGKMPAYEVLLKEVDPLLVASIRKRVPMVSDSEHLLTTLSNYLKQQGVEPSQPDLLLLLSRHEMSDEGMSIDIKVAIPVPYMLPDTDQISIQMLPGRTMASTVHVCDDLLGQAHAALYQWMQEHGYRLVSAPRHVHLQRAQGMDSGQDVTEVQFPVEKLEGH